MKLIVSTFNIQNKYHIKNYSGKVKDKDYTKDLIHYIKKYNIDILGIQEITREFQKRLLPKLEQYDIKGKYRLRLIGYFFRQYDEANSIISKRKINFSKTIQLPLLIGIPRILTKAIIRIENQEISIFNTHIEVSKNKLKKKQLNKIIKEIEHSNENTILMGDFNSTIDDPIFYSFIERLKDLNLKRVPLDVPTHKCRNKPIDHIFVPHNWNIEKVKTKTHNMSDHQSIIVNLSFNE